MKKSSTCANAAETKLGDLIPDSASHIAIACSGGSDSMALALIAQDWAKKNRLKIVALTVDHGLRKEAAQEARQVGAWLKKRSIVHHILPWKGKKPASNIQEKAREARYRLMTDYCRRHGISVLLVAHTLDDQAETFLLRIRRGSGVDGLSAMAESTDMYGICIVRPLLEIRKEELIRYLRLKKQAFISDPSNDNPAYDRIKIRKLMPLLCEAGFSVERLAATASTMARARTHLKTETSAFIQKYCDISDMGYSVLKALPPTDELALRVLSTILLGIGRQDVPLRMDALMRVYEAMKQPDFKGATVAGCKLQIARKEKGFLIFREQSAVGASVIIKSGASVVWDNRFEVNLQHATHNLQLGALTQKGWLEIAQKYDLKNPCPDKKILYALPALRNKAGHIVAVPHLHIGNMEFRVRFTGWMQTG